MSCVWIGSHLTLSVQGLPIKRIDPQAYILFSSVLVCACHNGMVLRLCSLLTRSCYFTLVNSLFLLRVCFVLRALLGGLARLFFCSYCFDSHVDRPFHVLCYVLGLVGKRIAFAVRRFARGTSASDS